MSIIKELYQSADWKSEKHVPVIDAPDTAKKGEVVKINVSVGKQIPHPNTTEHHISWIEVFFQVEGVKNPYQIGRFDFTAHGASTTGPNTSTVFTAPEITACFKTEKSGKIIVTSFCNIHGLWDAEKDIKID